MASSKVIPVLLVLLILGAMVPAPSAAQGSRSLQAWVMSPEMRITPSSFSQDFTTTAHAEAFRNEFVSLQFALRTGHLVGPFSAHCQEPAAGAGETTVPALPCDWVEIRYPAYILVDEAGGFLSDALFTEHPNWIEPNWTQGLWVTLHVPKTAQPGTYEGKLSVEAGSQNAAFTINLRVLDFALPDPPDWSFYLNIWQDPAAVAHWAHVPLWSEQHWTLLEAYARDLAEHGQKSITTSILHDPWRSQVGHAFPSMVEWRFPGEWESGQEDKFEFDYSVFDRYVALMMKAGVRRSIHCFSLVNGPGDSPDCDIGYLDTRAGQVRIRHTTVGDERYRRAWGVFLPAFVRHLKSQGWLDRTYVAFDEKPQNILNQILAVLRADAPGLKIALAGGSSSQESVSAGDLTIYYDDLSNPKAVEQLLAKRRRVGPTVFYTACAPYSPNTFIYSPLWESRMLPWISFRYGLEGYLRWAYQSWPDKVWTQPRSHWHSGDSYFVYPGDHGPISTTRWELLRQGIEDFEALHMLQARLAAMKKQSDSAGEAARLENSLNPIVAGAIDRDNCEDIPNLATARMKINRLLAEVTGKPMKETSPYTSDARTEAKFSPEDFSPDGNLEKKAWKEATWVKFDHDAPGLRHFPQAETEVGSLWTPTNVYFAFRCKYTTLNIYEGEDPAKERWELWNRDVAEVFLNPEPERVNHYYEFEVAPNNQWIDLEIDLDKKPMNDAAWDSGFEHATRVDAKDHVWTCEMRIPVAALGVIHVRPGMEWRINFFRADGPGDDSVRRFMAWSTIPGDEKVTFHVPTRFGLIRFVK